MRSLAWRLSLIAACLATATVAHAQTIAGTVKDDTGAVTPGVTIEVSSPALIEKTRSAVSDGTGQYKIVSLSPGVYTVTFSLPGFSTVKREGIEVTTDFTAVVNADLKIGALEETIIVSGGTPLVDIQSVSKQTVMSREMLDALPTSRGIMTAGVLIPGVTSSGSGSQGGKDVGGNTRLQQPMLTYHGSINTVQRWDGFFLGNLAGGGTNTSYYVNDSGVQELVYSTGADSLEHAYPGLSVNMIPKDGGNSFHGLVFSDFTYKPWTWSNLTDRLKARGINEVPQILHLSDFNPGAGGPILKDKIWYFAAYRYEALDSTVVGNFYNKSPVQYLYVPDLDRPAHDNGNIPNQAVRLTWQASKKDKVQFWATNQNKHRTHFGIDGNRTPEASSYQQTPIAVASTYKWSRTQTSRWFLEAGAAIGRSLFHNGYQPETIGDPEKSRDKDYVESLTIYSFTDSATGKIFGASSSGYSVTAADMEDLRLATTYVTGSHELKGGLLYSHATVPSPSWYTGDVTMTVNNGAASSVTLRLPRDTLNGYGPDLGLFAQDRWSIKRATINAGMRYDYLVGQVHDGTLPASRWSPAQFFPGFEAQHWKDISPRLGVAFDVFGDGKTAVKWNVARYIATDGVGTPAALNPQLTVGATDTRTWQDLNGDYSIYNADGSLQTAELGPTTNANFGKVIPSTTTRDPKTLNGFNARGSTVEWQGVVQQQVTPAIAVNGGYYFRWNGNQTITDNTRIDNSSFDGPFCITAPSSPDLPNGGNYQVCGLYDIKGTARGLVQNNTTFARNFGDGIIDHYMGFDLGATARFGGTTFFSAGLNAQKRVFDTCDTFVDSPEAQFCHQETPYRPDVKLLASYTLPWAVVVSGTYQRTSGPNITATWAVPGPIVTAALGRAQSVGATATKTIQLIEPGTIYGGYLNQLDLRVSKRLTLGRYHLRGDANLYNVTNSDFINAVNTTFSTSATSQYLRPTSVLQGRVFKLGGQIDF